MWEKKLLRKIYGEVRVDETSGDVQLTNEERMQTSRQPCQTARPRDQ